MRQLTIGKKSIVNYAITLAVFFTVVCLTVGLMAHNELLRVEERASVQSLNEALDTLRQDFSGLERLSAGMAAREDTTLFLQRGDYEYIKYNLSDDLFRIQNVNLLVLLDRSGRIMFMREYTAEQPKLEPSAQVLEQLQRSQAYSRAAADGNAVGGVMGMPSGPMLMVFQPVFYEKAYQGMVIVARKLDADEIGGLSQRSGRQTVVAPAAELPTGVEPADINEGVIEPVNMERRVDGNVVHSGFRLNDMDGSQQWRVGVEETREAYWQGVQTLLQFALLLLLSILFCGLTAFVLLERQVLSRLRAETLRLGQVKHFSDIAAFEPDKGSDEIACLSGKIKRVLHDLNIFYDRLEFLNKHDTLTGVFSRSYFERYKEEAGNAVEGRRGVIVCDIDGLKAANEIAGVSYGNAMLKMLVGAMQMSCPAKTEYFRVGGDDFIIIVPGAEEAGLKDICSNIQENIYRLQQEQGVIAVLFTVSLGSAVFARPAELGDALALAEQEMSQEKLLHSRSQSERLTATLRSALEARDYAAEGHSERMSKLMLSFGRRLSVPPTQNAVLQTLAEFHDVGKIGIAEQILFKRSALTPEEREKMQKHSEIGFRIARVTPALAPVADFILRHHEWWDGSGYPLGLSGESIPLECRMLAIVDAYDAMVSHRPYRQPYTKEHAIQELQKCAGTQFDPRLVKIFITLLMSGG